MNTSPVGMPLLPPGGGLRVSEPWNSSFYKARQVYIYEVDFPQSFSPGQFNLDATFQIQNDSDFFWTELTVFALDNNSDLPTRNTDILPALIFQVTDIATGRRYDSTLSDLAGFTGNLPPAFSPTGTVAPPVPNLSGNAQIPFLLTEPVLWEKNTVLKLTVNDEAAASGANGVYAIAHFSFIGIKAFY
jgi:hypothetical protein